MWFSLIGPLLTTLDPKSPLSGTPKNNNKQTKTKNKPWQYAPNDRGKSHKTLVIGNRQNVSRSNHTIIFGLTDFMSLSYD